MAKFLKVTNRGVTILLNVDSIVSIMPDEESSLIQMVSGAAYTVDESMADIEPLVQDEVYSLGETTDDDED
jgi:hypothetical protein